MARVSVGNEYFRQQERRRLQHQDEIEEQKPQASVQNDEVRLLQEQLESMKKAKEAADKQNEQLSTQVKSLQERIEENGPSDIMRRLDEIERDVDQKHTDIKHQLAEIRSLLQQHPEYSPKKNADPSEGSLGIPWGLPRSRPWSSGLESTPLTRKVSKTQKKLVPELGRKIPIFEDPPNSKPLVSLLPVKEIEPFQDEPNENAEFESIFVKPKITKIKQEPKIEPKQRPKRRTRGRPLANISNDIDEDENDDKVFDFVKQDDVLSQAHTRGKRRRKA